MGFCSKGQLLPLVPQNGNRLGFRLGTVPSAVFLRGVPIKKEFEPNSINSTDKNLAEQRIAQLRDTSRSLRAAAAEPTPSRLSGDQAKQQAEFSQWLGRASAEIEGFANRWESEFRTELDLARKTQEFNMQALMLQQKLQHECQQFTAVSDIMKAKQAATNSIINKLK